jgi:hypothetical protein
LIRGFRVQMNHHCDIAEDSPESNVRSGLGQSGN